MEFLTVTYTYLIKIARNLLDLYSGLLLCMKSPESGKDTELTKLDIYLSLFSFMLLACLKLGLYLHTEHMGLNGNRLQLLGLFLISN